MMEIPDKPITVVHSDEKEFEGAGFFEGSDRCYLIISNEQKWLWTKEISSVSILIAQAFWPKGFGVPMIPADAKLLEAEKVIERFKQSVKDEIARINQSVEDMVDEIFREMFTYKGKVYDGERNYYRSEERVCNFWADRYATSYPNLRKIHLWGCYCDIENQKEIARILREKHSKEVTQGFWYCKGGAKKEPHPGELAAIEAAHSENRLFPLCEDISFEAFLSSISG